MINLFVYCNKFNLDTDHSIITLVGRENFVRSSFYSYYHELSFEFETEAEVLKATNNLKALNADIVWEVF